MKLHQLMPCTPLENENWYERLIPEKPAPYWGESGYFYTTPWDIFACDESTLEMKRAAWEVLLAPWRERKRKDLMLERELDSFSAGYIDHLFEHED